MKEKIIISPIKPGYARLSGRYDDLNTGDQYLLMRGFVIKKNFFDKKDLREQFTFNFSDISPTFEIEYDTESQSTFDKKKREFVEIISRMPDVNLKGRKPETESGDNLKRRLSTRKMFTLTYLNGQSDEIANTIQEKNEAVVKFLNLGLAQMQDVAYNFGINASTLSKKAIINMMIGEKFDGLLLTKYINEFVGYDPENETVQYRILLNKAVHYKLINKSREGYVWAENTQYRGDFISKDFDGVCSYFSQNHTVKEWLQAEVNSLIEKDEAAQKEKETTKVEAKGSKPRLSEYDKLRQYALQIGVNPDLYKNIDTLTQAITRAENKELGKATVEDKKQNKVLA
jgi:hypothetical protein